MHTVKTYEPDDLAPEIGDTVVFSAYAEYGPIEDCLGTVHLVNKKGGIRVKDGIGKTHSVPREQYFVLARGE